MNLQGMEELVDAGMAENIGLSNFNKTQIERILHSARIKPCNLQVRLESNPEMLVFFIDNIQ